MSALSRLARWVTPVSLPLDACTSRNTRREGRSVRSAHLPNDLLFQENPTRLVNQFDQTDERRPE